MSPFSRDAAEAAALRRAQAYANEGLPPILPQRPAHLVVWYGDLWECTCGQRFDSDRNAENHYFVHH